MTRSKQHPSLRAYRRMLAHGVLNAALEGYKPSFEPYVAPKARVVRVTGRRFGDA